MNKRSLPFCEILGVWMGIARRWPSRKIFMWKGRKKGGGGVAVSKDRYFAVKLSERARA